MVGPRRLRVLAALCALLPAPPARARLLRGFGLDPPAGARGDEPQKKPARCYGCLSGVGCDCDGGQPASIVAYQAAPGGAASPRQGSGCTCVVEGESCRCSGSCSAEEQAAVCTELLGPCACLHSDDSVCECGGHCQTKADREGACWDEPGCRWTGLWCEAEVGLLWS